MNLPTFLDVGLQAVGLRPKTSTSYDLPLLQKALVGTDYLDRTNALGSYQLTGNQLQWLDPANEAIRKRLVGQVGRINAFFSKKAAALPWTLWKRGTDGKPEQLPFDHPLLDLLWQPNELTSYVVFMRQISTLYHADGNVYIWANKLDSGLNKGKPQELWILPSSLVEPIGGGAMKPVTAFRYTPDKSKPSEYEDLDPSEVLHLKNDPLPHERKGVSTIQSAFREATMDQSSSDAQTSLMQNQGPPGILSFPPDSQGTQITVAAPTIADIRARFDRKFTGSHNSGRIPIVTEKVEYTSTGVTAVDLNILQLRQANLRDLCGWWGFSAVLLGDMEASTDNNYQNARKAFYTDAILPYLESQVAEFSRWLCPMFEKGLWLQIDTSNVQELQEDKAALATWLSTAYWIPVERKAEIMGEPADENFKGYFVPAGLVHVNGLDELSNPDANAEVAAKLLLQYGISDYK